MRYPDKMQALADYAAGVGAITLADGHGRVVRAGEAIPTRLLGGELLAIAPIELRVGGFTLSIQPVPGMSPLSVARRVEGCKRLLRLLPSPAFGPPPEGGSDSGPANAEVRVWPPRARKQH